MVGQRSSRRDTANIAPPDEDVAARRVLAIRLPPRHADALPPDSSATLADISIVIGLHFIAHMCVYYVYIYIYIYIQWLALPTLVSQRQNADILMVKIQPHS